MVIYKPLHTVISLFSWPFQKYRISGNFYGLPNISITTLIRGSDFRGQGPMLIPFNAHGTLSDHGGATETRASRWTVVFVVTMYIMKFGRPLMAKSYDALKSHATNASDRYVVAFTCEVSCR